MNITGIIAEYNPFHMGHQYHIQAAKEQTRADSVVVIMSGPFVQRGCCAVADKYTRAKAALECGADLVLELPVVFATSSAEFFATGAVNILDHLGIITHLAFGSESTDIASMMQMAQILLDEPEQYRNALKESLSQGLSFPKARQNALTRCFPQLSGQLLLDQPNSILGIEYCKALLNRNSSIRPVVIKRLGGDYHDARQHELYSSATSIRSQLLEHSGQLCHIPKSQLPQPSFQALTDVYQHSFPIFDEDLSAMMRYALMQVSNRDYTVFLDVNEELSNRMGNLLFAYESFHQFATLLKTKELTYSRICRCLIHILLGIRTSHMTMAKQTDFAPYARVLAAKKEASTLLGEITRRSTIPVITNPADFVKEDSPVSRIISHEARTLFELDCYGSHIYNCIAGEKFHHATDNEFTRRFLKI